MQVSAGVRVTYSSSGGADSLKICAQIGFYKLNIIPAKPEKIKKAKLFRRRRKVKKVIEKKFKEEREEKEKQRYKIADIIGLAKDTGLILFKKLKKYLKIRIYKINISAGADDAYKTAALYANITQAAYYIYEIINNNFSLKAGKININPDFAGGKVNFDVDLKVSMKIGAGLNIVIAAAMAFMKFRAKIKSNTIKNNLNEERENKWQPAI
jgi:hypothetical protein